jgi:predicted nucleic acid-binding Zn ribbon protein
MQEGKKKIFFSLDSLNHRIFLRDSRKILGTKKLLQPSKYCYNPFAMDDIKNKPTSALRPVKKQCPSCGTSEILGRRRYCSQECRQQLFRRLHILSGLLRALGTRHATFSFTESSLVLDIKPQWSKKVYRFMHQRSHKQKPSQALYHLTDELSSVWWDKKNRTGKRYQACQEVLNMARKNTIAPDAVIPLEVKIPTRVKKFLASLKLTHKDLRSSRAYQTVKSAYRKQALNHHPDRGGNSAAFRKINADYQELISWLKSPVLQIHHGIPGKWYFDGKKWKTPLSFFVH